jgi:hypothetical protein
MLCWMRTTDRVDEHLLARAGRRAAETGRTLTAVLEDALRKSLQRRADRSKRARVGFTTAKGSGVRDGVDHDDSAPLPDATGSWVVLAELPNAMRVESGERLRPIIFRRLCGETGAEGNLVQDATFAAPAAEASHAALIEVLQ